MRGRRLWVAAQASVRWRGENRAAALRRARGAGLEPVTFERLPGDPGG
jgi:hypothetical protein